MFRGGGGYKPLIATSLAVALGVSVAGATGVSLGASGNIEAGAISDATQFQITSTNDSVAGILVKPSAPSAAITATVKGNVTLASSVLTSTTQNAYGIYVNNGTNQTTFSGDGAAFKTISIAGVTAGEGKEAYIFKNAGSGVTEFNKVGLVAGALPTTNAPTNFGIYAGLDGAKFDFGSAGTTFASAEQGIIVANNASFENNLTFTVITGAAGTKGANGANANDNGADGTAGGKAYGITATADGKTLNLNGNITFSAITGGAGGAGGDGHATGDTNGGNGGAGGDAYGIYLSGTNGLTIAGSGVITFTTVTGGSGGAGGAKGNNGKDGSQGANGNAYIINNASTGKTLALNGVMIKAGTGTGDAGFTGITTNLADAKFAFGSGSAKTIFGNIGTVENAGTSAGKNAIALNLAEDTTLSGNLEFGAIQGQNGGSTTKTGGNAIGLNLTKNKNITLENANITFSTLTAGNGETTSGNAYGIFLSSANSDVAINAGSNQANVSKIIFKGELKGGSTGTAGSSAIIHNASATNKINFGKDVSIVVSSDGSSSVDGIFGIYNAMDANYKFGGASSLAGTQFSVTGATGANGDANNDGTTGSDASGLIVSSHLVHEGNLAQTITGGTGGNGTASGKAGGAGGDAYGLRLSGDAARYELKNNAANVLNLTITGGKGGDGYNQATKGNKGDGGDAIGIFSDSTNATLTLNGSSSTILTIKGGAIGDNGADNTGTKGNATGILVDNGVLNIAGAGALNLIVGGDANIVGGDANTLNATGIELNTGVLNGNVTFSDTNFIKADTTSGTAIALKTSGESTYTGTLTINPATAMAGKTQKILSNTGTLSIGTSEIAGTIVAGGALNGEYANASFGISQNLANATYEFGTTNFGVIAGADGSSSAGKNAYGLAVGDNANIQGTLNFSIIQGGAGNGSGAMHGGNAVGVSIASGKTLTLIGNTTLNFANLVAGKKADSGSNGVAYGLHLVANDSKIASANSAKLTVSANSSANSVAALAFGDSTSATTIDYVMDLSASSTNGDAVAILALGNQANQVTKTLNVKSLSLGAENPTGKAYILKNSGTGSVAFANSASLVSGSVDESVAGVKYGIYHGIAGEYAFGKTSAGKAGTTFEVTGANGENGQKAVGIIMAENARFSGVLEQTITGGNATGENGKGGEAYGIEVIAGKEVTLTLADDSNAIFNVVGGKNADGSYANAAGISATGGKLVIVKETPNSGTNGKLTFNVGNRTTQENAVGVQLNDGVFEGSVNFAKVEATNGAYGILSEGNSFINTGSISFEDTAFDKGVEFAVIENSGTLTIGRGANIQAGTNSGIKAGIYNNIQGATYNLGNLNVAFNAGTSGAKSYAIYSDDSKSVFNVASGSTMELTAVATSAQDNFASSLAFGGSVNLNLAEGEATNLYLNANGGEIRNLVAGNNSTIYLSGKDKSTRVGMTKDIQYRTLTLHNLEVEVPQAKATDTAVDANTVYQGANYVVLASRNKDNKDVTKHVGSAYGVDGLQYTLDKNGSKIANQGGSDRIIVDAKSNVGGVQRVNSGLGIGLSGLDASNETKYVVLAQVSDQYVNIKGSGQADRLHNVVTFNGLTKDGDKALVESYDGFDVATLEIQRHDLATEEKKNLKVTDSGISYGEDWSNTGAVYVSDMVARNRAINESYAQATISAINTNFDLVSANLNSLSKRLGELRNTDNTHGLWGRVFAGQQTSKFGIEQTSTYLTFQAGYDYKLALENASNYVGFALSYVHSSSKQATAEFLTDANGTNKIAGNATSASDGVELALYNSYVADNGLYSDSIVKFGYFSSDLNIPAQADTYGVDNLAVAISEEVGYKVSLGEQNEWFITPQAELAYAFVNGSEFTQYIGSASLNTKQDAISMLRTRIGAAWGYNFDHYGKDKGIKASLYLGTYYAYDAIMGGKTNMLTSNGTAQEFENLESNGRFVLNVGTDVAVQDSTKFYVDFEKSFGNMMQTDYQVSVGVRYSFGSTSAKKDKKASESVLKPKELQKAE